MNFKDEVRGSLTEIKVELAKNTQTLMDHHVRSSNLEARFKPVEQHVILINNLVKIFIGAATAGASIVAVLHYLSK
jgi:hypothetical protein